MCVLFCVAISCSTSSLQRRVRGEVGGNGGLLSPHSTVSGCSAAVTIAYIQRKEGEMIGQEALILELHTYLSTIPSRRTSLSLLASDSWPVSTSSSVTAADSFSGKRQEGTCGRVQLSTSPRALCMVHRSLRKISRLLPIGIVASGYYWLEIAELCT